MEVLQAAEFLFFAMPTGTPSPSLGFELENSTKIHAHVNQNTSTYLLGGKVTWPAYIAMSPNGTIRFKLMKKTPGEVWADPLMTQIDDRPRDALPFQFPIRDLWPVEVLSTKILNPTTCEIVIKHRERAFIYHHPGHYICIYLRLKGRRTGTPFYPTVKFPFHNLTYPNIHPYNYIQTDETMTILVNDYGRKDSLQDRICTKRPINDTLYISNPKGGFSVSYMAGINYIQVICESNGIGAALPVIFQALQTNPQVDITVLYFNHDEEDIIYREYLNRLAEYDSRFRIKYILKNPNKGWSGWKGVMKVTYLNKILQKWNPTIQVYSIMAGHRQFVFPIATWLVDKMGYPMRTVYRLMTL